MLLWNTWARSPADTHRPEAGARPLRGPSTGGGDAAPGRWASRGTFCSRSDRVGSLITPWLMCRGPGHAPALLGVHGRGLAWEGGGPVPAPLCSASQLAGAGGVWPARRSAGGWAGPGHGSRNRPGSGAAASPGCWDGSAVWPWGGEPSSLWGVQSHVSVGAVCSQPVTQPLWASGSSCVNDNNSARLWDCQPAGRGGSPAR